MTKHSPKSQETKEQGLAADQVRVTPPQPFRRGLRAFVEEMKEDIQAVKRSDPAARNTIEIVGTYPGLHAIWSHRVSHKLWNRGNHIWARLLAHTARHWTGIEIHPAAQIGRRVFIDHGMGVVIGETTVIGDDCLIYKGVVLGGTTLSQTKRHPTLGSGVVVGSNACILGAVEIGDDARVGSGSVVIKDVPNKATVIGIPGRIVSRRQKVEQLPLPRLDHAALPDPMMRLVHKMFTSMEALSERIQTLEHHTDLSPEQLAEVLEPDTLQTELEEAFLALYEESEITNEPR